MSYGTDSPRANVATTLTGTVSQLIDEARSLRRAVGELSQRLYPEPSELEKNPTADPNTVPLLIDVAMREMQHTGAMLRRLLEKV